MIKIKAKCVCCGEVKEIKEGDIKNGDHPMCDKCFSPMVAVSASN